MQTIVPFTAATVDTYLKDRHLRFFHEGGLFVFGYDDTDLGRCIVQIIADEDKQFLDVRLTWSSFSVHQQDRLEILCGEWNKKRPLPKAFTYVDDESLLLVAQGVLPIAGVGIHQELIDVFCEVVIRGAMNFAGWIVVQNRLHEKLLADLFDTTSDDG